MLRADGGGSTQTRSIAVWRVAKCCDERVRASVCLSVRARISETDNESLQVFLLAKKNNSMIEQNK